MNANKRQATQDDFLAKPFTCHCSKQTINSPDKKRTIAKNKFAAPHNQIQKTGTIEDIVNDLMRGHEVIPVEFGLIGDEDVIRRRKKNWKSQQVIILDVDHATEKFQTLSDFVENHPFVKNHAEVLWINRVVSKEWLDATIKKIKADLEAEETQRAKQQEEQERRRQESNARSQREGEYPLTALAKTDPAFYLSHLEEKPLTLLSSDRSGWNQWGSLGEVKATCSQGDLWSNEVHREITNLRTDIQTCRTRIIDSLNESPKTLSQLDKATQSPSFITDLLHRGLIQSDLFNMTYHKAEGRL